MARLGGGAKPRMPFGIGIAAGIVVLIVACGAAALFPESGARLAVVVGATATWAAVLGDARGAFTVAGIGYLLYDGFLVNRYGELGWLGSASERQIAVFAGATLAGLGLHAISRFRVAGFDARSSTPEREKELIGG